jgi:hypothetical protein
METHVKVLGILHIALGALGVLAALIVFAIFGGVAGLLTQVPQEGEVPPAAVIPIVGAIGGFIIILILVLSVPGIVAGIGLLQYREWARMLTLVLSALNLLNVPFGTALGIYAFWALLKPETAALFQRPPVRQYSRM